MTATVAEFETGLSIKVEKDGEVWELYLETRQVDDETTGLVIGSFNHGDRVQSGFNGHCAETVWY